MTRARQERLLSLLAREDEWVTGAVLADALGVTPRSIRTYVTAINARSSDGEAIASGPLGYRALPAAVALRASVADDSGPRHRLHSLVRALVDADEGIDLAEESERLHVSPATLDGDLARVRSLLAGTELVLERSATRARVRGGEGAKRRLLSRLAHDEMDAGAFDAESLRRTLGTVDAERFAPFKAALVAELGALGYYVNELGIADVVTHIAIAVDRVAQGRRLESSDRAADPRLAPVESALAELTREHFDVELGEGDLRHLATLVLTRVVAPGAGSTTESVRARLDPEVERLVREVVAQAAAEYLVDLDAEDFVLRLALHVQNLIQRAREQAWSRNPLTWSLKSSHPMIFELAVFIASGLQERLGIEIQDDEIAYIAMHVGGRLERARRPDAMLTATIVCPGYHELHELLRSSVDRSLGRDIEVVGVETRVDPDWESLDTDLILSTIEPTVSDDRVVRIQPFLTDGDVERVRSAAARVRRARRLGRLRDELQRYLDESAFVRGIEPEGEEALIRRLGARLVAQGVIDEEYVEHTIERERMSSTAFTEALAVPHSLRMTASRTAIALGIADQSIPWGSGRVQVVALVAFSEGDREAFQTVFEQFVEVFSERESVARLVRRGVDFASFLDELVAVIDG